MRKHASRRRRSPPPDGEQIERFRPKAGPGQVFKRELVDVKSGYAKRYRNIATTPLALAYWRGQLCGGAGSKVQAEDRLAAGEHFERLWYTLHRTGLKDSTDHGVGGFDGLFFTEAKQIASTRLANIRERMQRTNYHIVCLFCGEGESMAEAIRRAGIEAHQDGTVHRIREALDDLVYATTGTRENAGDAGNTSPGDVSGGIIHPFQLSA